MTSMRCSQPPQTHNTKLNLNRQQAREERTTLAIQNSTRGSRLARCASPDPSVASEPFTSRAPRLAARRSPVDVAARRSPSVWPLAGGRPPSSLAGRRSPVKPSRSLCRHARRPSVGRLQPRRHTRPTAHGYRPTGRSSVAAPAARCTSSVDTTLAPGLRGSACLHLGRPVATRCPSPPDRPDRLRSHFWSGRPPVEGLAPLSSSGRDVDLALLAMSVFARLTSSPPPSGGDYGAAAAIPSAVGRRSRRSFGAGGDLKYSSTDIPSSVKSSSATHVFFAVV